MANGYGTDQMAIHGKNTDLNLPVRLEKIHPADPAVIIGFVIIRPGFRIHAAGIRGNIISPGFCDHRSPDHRHTVQDVEKLGHIRLFLFRRH